MAYFTFTSVAPLVQLPIAPRAKTGRTLVYHVVFLEPGLERVLTFARGNKLRVEAEIEGVPLHGAWLSSPGRGHYLMISPGLMKELGLSLEDEVTVRFKPESEDVVRVPEELEQALAAKASWRRLWEALTPGRRRGLSFFVSNAKGAATRARRVQTVFDELSRGVVEKTGPRQRRARRRPS